MLDQVKNSLFNSYSLQDIHSAEIKAVLKGVLEHGYWLRWEALSKFEMGKVLLKLLVWMY
ncbi:hypothetical protein ELAC_1262 [Estrella lausannensis]|uniref:Uncharacterized protein n=1 Tax=Estrella lausannensis TaxID=483423 RepID=A0A0H5DR34_9BACT|nr:hypothetical protein ELAC_1262 [Estrella lausannensis]